MLIYRIRNFVDDFSDGIEGRLSHIQHSRSEIWRLDNQQQQLVQDQRQEPDQGLKTRIRQFVDP